MQLDSLSLQPFQPYESSLYFITTPEYIFMRLENKSTARLGIIILIVSELKCKINAANSRSTSQIVLNGLGLGVCTSVRLITVIVGELRCWKWFLTSLHSVKDVFSTTKSHVAWPWTNVTVCTTFQVASSRTFGVIVQKLNLTFVTSVTLEIKVMAPKRERHLRGSEKL